MALDLASFEPLMDTPPYRVLDYHPDGMLVALQALTSHPLTTTTASFSGIWDRHTRRLVWAPENVIAMAWGSDGKEVGLLRERYTYDPGMHAIIGSALQSEFTYTWERRTWPEQMLLSSCPLVIPTGWPETLAISPRHTLAAFQWFDQSESGLEFISLTEDGDFQLLETGLPISTSVTPHCFRPGGNGYPIGSNLATTPAFSPDGRYLVFGWHDEWTWWADLGEDAFLTDETPSKVGPCHAGFLEVLDWEERCAQTIAVTVSLPPSWHPSSLDGAGELFGDPHFLDNEHFTLPLPTGEARTYHVHTDGK